MNTEKKMSVNSIYSDKRKKTEIYKCTFYKLILYYV